MEVKEGFSREYALNRNTINLFGVVDNMMADLITSELQYLDDKFKREEVPLEDRIITLQINRLHYPCHSNSLRSGRARQLLWGLLLLGSVL